MRGSTLRRTTMSPGSAIAGKEATAATKAARPRAQAAPVDASAFVPSFVLAADAWQNSLPRCRTRRVIFIFLPARKRATSVPIPWKPVLARVCGCHAGTRGSSPQGGSILVTALKHAVGRRSGSKLLPIPRTAMMQQARWHAICARTGRLALVASLLQGRGRLDCPLALDAGRFVLRSARLRCATPPGRRAGRYAETGTP